MNDKVQTAIKPIMDAISKAAVSDSLSTTEYRDLLESVIEECEGRIDGLNADRLRDNPPGD